MSKDSIGPKIKRFRKSRHLTQEELAESLGYSHKSVITHIEKGDTDMTYEKILLLLRIYMLDANELFDVSDIDRKLEEYKIKQGKYKQILVSGLINIETSLKVDSFPINYNPIEYPFFGIESVVSGVGYNVAKALKTLGSNIDLLTEIGDDLNGEIIKKKVNDDGIDTKHLFEYKDGKTAESVVLVDKEGKRKIYCDLKDIQDRKPLDESVVNLDDYSLVALTNINFNRTLIKAAHNKGIIVATDVHVLSDINDSYNKDFMENANILFLSNEAIIDHETDFVKELYNRYHNKIIVCGCGEKGALMYIGEEDKFYFEQAVAPKGISSTVGAGYALFSSFIHFYNKGEKLENCLRFAVLFAGIKISQPGGSNGFVNKKELLKFARE